MMSINDIENVEIKRERINIGDLVVLVIKKTKKKIEFPEQTGLVLKVSMINGRGKVDLFWNQSQKYESVYTDSLINLDDLKENDPNKKTRGKRKLN